MALTSIIITTHDRPTMLPRAVESARRAGANVEIVLVDDGSRDETSAVCASWPDIVYVRLEERHGVGYARAAGIAASSGTFISFLDDDDVRLPGSIDRQLAVLEAAPEAALVYGQTYGASQSLAIKGHGPLPRLCPTGDIFWRLIHGNFMAACSVVMRRSAMESVGGLCHQVTPADDWDLWLRLSERYPVVALSEPVAIYREPTLWSNQGSSRLADGPIFALWSVLDRCAQRPRAMENPHAYQRAVRRMQLLACRKLLTDSVRAAGRGDAYALVSLRHAVATGAAVVREGLVAVGLAARAPGVYRAPLK